MVSDEVQDSILEDEECLKAPVKTRFPFVC